MAESRPLTDREREMFRAGDARYASIEASHRAGQADVRLLQGLVGQLIWSYYQKGICKITYLHYNWGGRMSASGYRLRKDGTFGSRSRWELGTIDEASFDHPELKAYLAKLGTRRD